MAKSEWENLMREQQLQPKDDASRVNDLDPTIAEAEVVEEPETWSRDDVAVPMEVAAPDWQEQQAEAVEDPFDDGTEGG